MATSTKPFWQSKTLWFNVITVIVAVVGDLTKTFNFTGTTAEIFAGVLSVGNILLRLLTSTSLTTGTTS